MATDTDPLDLAPPIEPMGPPLSGDWGAASARAHPADNLRLPDLDSAEYRRGQESLAPNETILDPTEPFPTKDRPQAPGNGDGEDTGTMPLIGTVPYPGEVVASGRESFTAAGQTVRIGSQNGAGAPQTTFALLLMVEAVSPTGAASDARVSILGSATVNSSLPGFSLPSTKTAAFPQPLSLPVPSVTLRCEDAGTSGAIVSWLLIAQTRLK